MEDKLAALNRKTDPLTGIIINKYSKGRQLGKGGFAKCYEIINLHTNQKYAAKIIDKSTLTRSKAKQKLASEIKIHKTVQSSFVVGYERFFQDQNHVYIVLELCVNQTLNELVKRRKRITEVETKYYLHQLALAIKDLHSQNVIHRDLKLGNLLLTDKLEIRVADFGLAAKVNSIHERRKTTCGTPNYIAPQILDSNLLIQVDVNGHSFQVDIWSLGIITYAFLVGRPPFETNDIKATYSKIKACNYSYPQGIVVSPIAKSFISKMLQRDPRHRATIQQILNDEFFSVTPFPRSLPICTLACPPNSNFIKQFTQVVHNQSIDRRTKDSTEGLNCSQQAANSKKDLIRTDRALQKNDSVNRVLVRTNSIDQMHKNPHVERAASTAALMRGQKMVRTDYRPQIKQGCCIWVIYYEENTKFGMSYMLNSNAVGMRFNDSTFLISNADFTKLKYMQSLNGSNDGVVFDIGSQIEGMAKKLKIITYYQKQLKLKKQQNEGKMSNQQLIEREKQRYRESKHQNMHHFVVKHCKTSKVNIFWFNNKDYQIIFKDSTELLISKDNVCYVNKAGVRRHFQKQNLSNQPEQVKKRMDYINKIIQTLKENRDAAQRSSSNKQNKPESTQTLLRSSSVYKMDKPKMILLKGCSSTSRLPVRKIKN